MNVSDFNKLTNIDYDIIGVQLKNFVEYYKVALQYLGISTSEVKITKKSIMEIVELIEKRRIYFKVFYDDCNMGELNETALACFWILKLFPFNFKNDFGGNKINVDIAIYFFMNRLDDYAKKNNKKLNYSYNIIENLNHSFRYRDISKEALMSLALALIY